MGGKVEIRKHFPGLRKNGVFYIAALAVFGVQFRRQGFGAGFVGGEQQFQPAPGAAQPPPALRRGPS